MYVFYRKKYGIYTNINVCIYWKKYGIYTNINMDSYTAIKCLDFTYLKKLSYYLKKIKVLLGLGLEIFCHFF